MQENKKYAVLSMDVEDWYHLYYFLGKADTSYSMLDGFTNYVDLLNSHNIKTTFFVLSELAQSAKDKIQYAVSCGHEIACHGKTHMRPLDLSPEVFRQEITQAKAELEEITGKEVIGYRAPCYGIDDERYQIVQEVGFKYSSSKMDVTGHPLYGEIDLSSFEQKIKGIYIKDNMTEFALSTQKLLGKDIAVSGGGWIRLLPWSTVMKPLLKKYISQAQTYALYIHPFELSRVPMPKVPNSNLLSNIRARRGLEKVEKRIDELIGMLRENGFEFDTFANIQQSIQKQAVLK
ncbi:MAG: DUF3473 domain-containing protein [Ruminococcaceae bacterium]|nr:DUF3473 domain-containing protein [Oscillospiraceae bacterium]